MNYSEVTHQIYTLAQPMNCVINGMKIRSEKELKEIFRPLLLTDKGQIIYEQVLPDGRWFCKITKNGRFFDYYVPDTRTQEQKLIDELFRKRQ